MLMLKYDLFVHLKKVYWQGKYLLKIPYHFQLSVGWLLIICIYITGMGSSTRVLEYLST